MSAIRDISNYAMSTDYEVLFSLAQKNSVVCEIQNDKLRDIAHTVFWPNTFEIASRGFVYIYAQSKDDFIASCERYAVRFIIPHY